MSTPHIEAKKGDFAPVVIMPGDPLRAKWIAEHFLEQAKQVTSVRNVYGYTGTYQNKPVSVMASGMGMPSMGIYSYELYHFYDVNTIIRVGSAGALSPNLKLRDIVIAQSVSTDSNYIKQFNLPGTFAPTGTYRLIESAVRQAKKFEVNAVVGNILCSDVFYSEQKVLEQWRDMGVLAVEMESAALYSNASKAQKEALCICTISDCPLTNQSCSSEERQTSFSDMVKIALNIAVE